MKRTILILGFILILASLVTAAETTIFDAYKTTDLGNEHIVLTCDKCTITGGQDGIFEDPNSQDDIVGKSDYEVTCTKSCSITIKKDDSDIANLVLTNAMLKIPSTGKYAGIIHEIKTYKLTNTKTSQQDINGMKVELMNGAVIDFWHGRDTMDNVANYNAKYFDSFTLRLDPTTKPESVKDIDGKEVYDTNSAFKEQGLKIPKSVMTKSKSNEEQKQVPVLNVCGQNFYNLYAEKTYGSSESSTVASDPNTLSGRKVISEKKTSIEVQKDARGCTITSYRISTKNKDGDSIFSFNDLKGANFCGTYFLPATKNEISNIDCTYEKDSMTLACNDNLCDNVRVAIPTKYKDYSTIKDGIALYFLKDNPLFKIKIEDLKEGIASYDFDMGVTPSKDVKGREIPNGLVFYKKSSNEENKNIRDQVRAIGINKISKIISQGQYIWTGSSSSWIYRKQVWQPPQVQEEKKAKIITNNNQILVYMIGGTVSSENEKQTIEFVLSNQYKLDPKSKFPGYQVEIKNQDIIEITKEGSISQDKLDNINGVTIRELKPSLIPPVLFGEQTVTSTDATGGQKVFDTKIPLYILLRPLSENEKTIESLPKYVFYVVQHKETIQGILDKFGPCSCEGRCDSDSSNRFVKEFKELNPELNNYALDQSIVSNPGETKTLKIPTSSSTFTRKDVTNVLRIHNCQSASKALTKSKLEERNKIIQKITKLNSRCDNTGGFCQMNTGDYETSGNNCNIESEGRIWIYTKYMCKSKERVLDGDKIEKLNEEEYARYQCCVPTKQKTIPTVTKNQALKSQTKQKVCRPGDEGDKFCESLIPPELDEAVYCDAKSNKCAFFKICDPNKGIDKCSEIIEGAYCNPTSKKCAFVKNEVCRPGTVGDKLCNSLLPAQLEGQAYCDAKSNKCAFLKKTSEIVNECKTDIDCGSPEHYFCHLGKCFRNQDNNPIPGALAGSAVTGYIYCKDTDEGKIPLVKGTTTVYQIINNKPVMMAQGIDECLYAPTEDEVKYVREYSCENNRIKEDIIDCSKEQTIKGICKDGECPVLVV